ncbi:hypothetical protein DSC45_29520 [Streptomyces sp. YIM 130001]|uniref:hypothetical protein n=1 Tax=Streptomyces sp. YIM 130001 TaxID=2259644 RepID=UPI000E64A38A|nr:hypothetical protein [Streptomyces sp. YIM 130001]RII09647.1 hypothetical protein DSC45_29520 [Streptomyces sp. YIM 130001]
MRRATSPQVLAGLLAGAGVTHFLLPKPFDSIVPRALPGSPRMWTQVSGAAELALAAGVAFPRTRARAASAAAVFFVAVVPANMQMAVDWRSRPATLRRAAQARVPLQAGLVLWARKVARDATR